MKREHKVKLKGVARVKKFGADQDETIEEPQEIVETEFELTPDQAEEVKNGASIEIKNGKTEVKHGANK